MKTTPQTGPYSMKTTVAVAVANKMARIVWALMTTGKRFATSPAA